MNCIQNGNQQCFNFDKLTMVDAIADQLAIQRGRIHPSKSDNAEAQKMFDGWNLRRLDAGLKRLDNDHEPPELEIIEVESEDEE